MEGRRGFGAVLLVTLAVWLVAGAAPAAAAPTYHHTVHRAMGLVPAHGTIGHYDDPAVGSQAPVVYRGGSTMTTGTVTVHTIFWAPPGYHFTGSPSAGVLGYEPLIKQFFTDVAQASGSGSNLFSVLGQYGDPSGSGRYSIAYNPATDSIDDTAPYPSTADQCASPGGTRTCVTDGEVSQQIDRLIQTTDPSGRGLHNLWEVFLPPDVDECIYAGECGTDYYSAYHSLADWGHGTFMYALMIDPMIEYTPLNGSDPEGNPDAESAIDSAAHETIEAITDPEGTGWTTSYSYEVGDVCETQYGTPLGYAADGSPYNQLINGHPYEIQDMWANNPIGCVQSSPTTTDGLPLPTMSLTQFSSRVSGSIARPRGGVAVRLQLFRGPYLVARASGVTRANGSWGPLVLRDAHGSPRAVGDDRDLINVNYGAGGPPDDQIATGSGGNPFAEGGWTGWAALDTSAYVFGNSVTVGPCFQTGVFTVTVNGQAIASPTPECNTQTDTATVATPRLTLRSRIDLSDLDNRAQTGPGAGALVRLTVPLGEPGSAGSDTGLPYCSAQLRLQTVACNGLVAGEHYRLRSSRAHAGGRARANLFGISRFSGFRIAGGEVLTLINSVGRVITRLHVAHLRVAIRGDQSVIASGTCQPGDYWGGPFGLSGSSLSAIILILESGGAEFGGSSPICGPRGRAKGVSSRQIEQEDAQSGGFTSTSIPQLGTHIPAANAVISSRFRALAQTGFRGPDGGLVPAAARVSLTITHAGKTVFDSANVERPGGVSVRRFAVGNYWAKWVISDRNGDTRTVLTRFEEG
jgi:hypothetical protein